MDFRICFFHTFMYSSDIKKKKTAFSIQCFHQGKHNIIPNSTLVYSYRAAQKRQMQYIYVLKNFFFFAYNVCIAGRYVLGCYRRNDKICFTIYFDIRKARTYLTDISCKIMGTMFTMFDRLFHNYVVITDKSHHL